MKKIKLEFTNDQLQVLNAAICELPYRVAAPLIQHINSQIQKIHDEAADIRNES